MLRDSIGEFSSMIQSGGKSGIELVLDKLPMGVVLLEVRDTIHVIYKNRLFFDVIGHTRETCRDMAHNVCSIIIENDRGKLYSAVNSRLDFSVDCRCIDKNNEIRWIQFKGVSVDFVKSVYPVYLVTVNDIGQYKALEKDLKINFERYRIFEETTPALLFEYNIRKDTMTFSKHGENGIERRVIENYTEFNKRTPLVHPNDVSHFMKCIMEACVKSVKSSLEYRTKSINGEYTWCRTYYVSFMNEYGVIESVFGRIQDISEEIVRRNEMAKLIENDNLTQTYNREAFITKVGKSLDEANENTNGYFVMLDIDNFKTFNDSYGHLVGDNVLITVANYLSSSFKDGIVGRFGGDEFVIYIEDVSREELEKRFKKVIDYSNCIVDDKKVKLTCSIGAVSFKGALQYEVLFRHADNAMYEAKRNGKNNIVFESLQ